MKNFAETKLLIEWYKLKPNPDKWQLILNKNEPTRFLNVAIKSIFNNENEKVLGVYLIN